MAKGVLNNSLLYSGYLSDNEGLLDAIVRVHYDDTFDHRADEYRFERGSQWVDTMNYMRNTMTFDVDKLKLLYPDLFWGSELGLGCGAYSEVMQAWASIAQNEKLTWIYTQIRDNPIVLINSLV
ncbi:MAG TPA: hypothetical protein VLS94_07395 [Fusibacter sp.]|nr:hypothetical protein [Fusibacter sp.]